MTSRATLRCGTGSLRNSSKTDNAFHGGICDVLSWEEAKLLQSRNVRHYNWQQDLGLKGLQQSKKKYQPCHFLKKFTVRKP